MISHLTAIWRFRHFLTALVRLDLRLRYRRSVLGIGWSLLYPIAMTAVYVMVFGTILGDGDIPNYAPRLLLGMAIWSFFRDATVSGCRALIANEAYIRQCPLPYGIYPLRTILGQSIHSAIALAVAMVVVVLFKSNWSASVVYTAPFTVFWSVIPAVLLGILLAWALATIFAFANVYFQDTQHILEIGAQLLFFLTPIMYKREVLEKRGLGFLIDLNPVNLFLDLIRDPLLTGHPPTLSLYLTAAATTAVFTALAAGTIAWLQKRVIFHL